MTEIIATVGMVMNDRVTGTKYRIIYPMKKLLSAKWKIRN